MCRLECQEIFRRGLGHQEWCLHSQYERRLVPRRARNRWRDIHIGRCTRLKGLHGSVLGLPRSAVFWWSCVDPSGLGGLAWIRHSRLGLTSIRHSNRVIPRSVAPQWAFLDPFFFPEKGGSYLDPFWVSLDPSLKQDVPLIRRSIEGFPLSILLYSHLHTCSSTCS